MRLVGSRHKDKSGGYYIHRATTSFWGDNGECEQILEAMGLPTDKLPFSMAFYLKKHNVQWRDKDNKLACLSFCVTDYKMEFYASYNGMKRTAALWREWETYEDKDDIRKLESDAIGEMSMRCLYDKMFPKK